MQQVHEAAKTLPSGSAPRDPTDSIHELQLFPSTNSAPTVSVLVKAQVLHETRPAARTRVNSAAMVPTRATRSVIKHVTTTVGAGTSTGFVPKRGNAKPTTAALPTQTPKASNPAGPSATAAPQSSGSTQTTKSMRPEQGPAPPRGRTVSNVPRPAWGGGRGARSTSAKPGERQRTTSSATAPAPVIVAKARNVLPRDLHVPTVTRTANGGSKLALSAATTATGRPMLKKSTSMASLNVRDKFVAGAHISVAAKATVASAARTRQPYRPVRHKGGREGLLLFHSLPLRPQRSSLPLQLPFRHPQRSQTLNSHLPSLRISHHPRRKPLARSQGCESQHPARVELGCGSLQQCVVSTPGSEKKFPGLSKSQEESGGVAKINRSPLGEIPLNAAS
jgi:hypothetical protein